MALTNLTSISNSRTTAEMTGRAFLDTLGAVSESSLGNPVALGSILLAELRARGLALAPIPVRDGIFRRDQVLRVAP